MITTVTQPHTQGTNKLPQAVDRVISQMRSAANRVGEAGPFTVSTTGVSTPTVLWESPEVGPNTATDITAYVRGVSGTNAARFLTDVSVTRQGNATPVASPATTIVNRRPFAVEAYIWQINAAANTIQLIVVDGGIVYDWYVWIETRTVDTR